eukprot:04525_6
MSRLCCLLCCPMSRLCCRRKRMSPLCWITTPACILYLTYRCSNSQSCLTASQPLPLSHTRMMCSDWQSRNPILYLMTRTRDSHHCKR